MDNQMIWPLLHGSTDGSFLTSWNIEPAVLAGLLFASIGYALCLRWIARTGLPLPPTWRIVSYFSGLGALAIALVGPLDTFNDELFFLHMLQHVVLMLVAAPLILLGQPVQVALRASVKSGGRVVLRAVLRPGWTRRVLTVLTHPLVAVTLFNLTVVVWHIPELYTLALEQRWVHELEHMTFTGTALLFWWIIIDPVPRHHKLSAHVAILALFVSATVGDLLGLTLLLAPDALYAFYEQADRLWGISSLADQRLSGLIMLVSGSAVFFGTMFLLIAQAVSTPNDPTQRLPATGSAAPAHD